jgi:hypothetical protein
MTAQFAIIRFPEGWRILQDGKKRGRFNFQVDATEAALRLADELRRAGRTVEVLVQDMFGELVKLRLPDLAPRPA